MLNEQGPYLQVACFCESVLQEQDGVMSLIRIVDTVTHTAVGADPPDDLPPFTHRLKLVVTVKSGDARGRFNLRITPVEPSGLQREAINLSGHHEGGERGQNFVADVNYTYTQEGVYWFRVEIDEDFLTAVPLRIRYQRVTTGRGAR